MQKKLFLIIICYVCFYIRIIIINAYIAYRLIICIGRIIYKYIKSAGRKNNWHNLQSFVVFLNYTFIPSTVEALRSIFVSSIHSGCTHLCMCRQRYRIGIPCKSIKPLLYVRSVFKYKFTHFANRTIHHEHNNIRPCLT